MSSFNPKATTPLNDSTHGARANSTPGADKSQAQREAETFRHDNAIASRGRALQDAIERRRQVRVIDPRAGIAAAVKRARGF